MLEKLKITKNLFFNTKIKNPNDHSRYFTQTLGI